MSSCLAFWCSDLLEVFDDADLRLISDDLFASDDLFVSDDEDQGLSLLHRVPCDAHEYDLLQQDDYEPRALPEVPEEVSRKEQELITRQLAHIDARIRRGGDEDIILHYVKVREELRQQLDTCRGLDTYESGDKSPSNLSRASTCDTDLAETGRKVI
mmetsp:Transcript_105703/g.252142  ORF Transcript_105703/g.252142 Transcript_105703/m.252142 type:complete len:157 (+) Transcript_105703:54-524(+)